MTVVEMSIVNPTTIRPKTRSTVNYSPIYNLISKHLTALVSLTKHRPSPLKLNSINILSRFVFLVIRQLRVEHHLSISKNALLIFFCGFCQL